MYGDEAKEIIKELHALLTDRPEFIYTVQVCMGRAEGASCGAGTGWQAARVVGRGRRLSLSLIWWWVGGCAREWVGIDGDEPGGPAVGLSTKAVRGGRWVRLLHTPSRTAAAPTGSPLLATLLWHAAMSEGQGAHTLPKPLDLPSTLRRSGGRVTSHSPTTGRWRTAPSRGRWSRRTPSGCASSTGSRCWARCRRAKTTTPSSRIIDLGCHGSLSVDRLPRGGK